MIAAQKSLVFRASKLTRNLVHVFPLVGGFRKQCFCSVDQGLVAVLLGLMNELSSSLQVVCPKEGLVFEAFPALCQGFKAEGLLREHS